MGYAGIWEIPTYGKCRIVLIGAGCDEHTGDIEAPLTKTIEQQLAQI